MAGLLFSVYIWLRVSLLCVVIIMIAGGMMMLDVGEMKTAGVKLWKKHYNNRIGDPTSTKDNSIISMKEYLVDRVAKWAMSIPPSTVPTSK